MKKWAALTVLLYILLLVALTVPVSLIAFGRWWFPKDAGTIVGDAAEIYQEWGYWTWLALMGSGQALLLVVPVKIAERKLKSRRPLLVPIVTTAFFLANLFLSGLISLLCALFAEKGFDLFTALGELTWSDAVRAPAATLILKSAPTVGKAGLEYILGMLTALSCFWLVWVLIFYFSTRNDDPETLVNRSTRWLLRGSILELLVAVPSHVIVRNRHDCCAPFGTFWGISTGLSVMFLCFGPGVFFLLAEKFGRLRPKHNSVSSEDARQQAK